MRVIPSQILLSTLATFDFKTGSTVVMIILILLMNAPAQSNLSPFRVATRLHIPKTEQNRTHNTIK